MTTTTETTTDTTTIATPAAEAAPAGAVFFDGPSARTRIIALKWPFTMDGVKHREVTLRRINGNEARAYYAATLATLQDGAAPVVFPGLSLSQAAWEALDDDDVTAIDQAVEAFLPARFQPLLALLNRMMGQDADGEASATGAS